MKILFFLSISFCYLFFTTLVTGCTPRVQAGLDRATRDQIQRAIDELSRQPDRWEQSLSNLTDKVGGEARETIVLLRQEMTGFVQESTQTLGIEGRCNADFFVGQHVKHLTGNRVLSSLKQMLSNNEPNFVLPPWICHVTPDNFVVDNEGLPVGGNPGEEEKLLIKLTGFGFTSENVEKAEVQIRDESGQKLLKKLGRTLDHVSPYVATFNIQRVKMLDNGSSTTSREGRKLRILWTDRDYSEVSILLREPTPTKPLPPPIVVTGLQATFYTHDEDKDDDTGVSVTIQNVTEWRQVQKEKFSDDSYHIKSLTSEAVPLTSLTGKTIEICISPNGNDTWRFSMVLSGLQSNGHPYSFSANSVELNEDTRCKDWVLP